MKTLGKTRSSSLNLRFLILRTSRTVHSGDTTRVRYGVDLHLNYFDFARVSEIRIFLSNFLKFNKYLGYVF
ncbi:TPA: hypothetical protein DCZ36_00600 [Candidatus Gracilibacteria bacterium]|nr:hypothetical protein [Candidatus Gracilibacteria bacterium]